MLHPFFGRAHSNFRGAIDWLRRWRSPLPLSLAGGPVARSAPLQPRRPLGVEALEERLPPGSLFNPPLGGTSFAVGMEDLDGAALTAALETDSSVQEMGAGARPKDNSFPLLKAMSLGTGSQLKPDRLTASGAPAASPLSPSLAVGAVDGGLRSGLVEANLLLGDAFLDDLLGFDQSTQPTELPGSLTPDARLGDGMPVADTPPSLAAGPSVPAPRSHGAIIPLAVGEGAGGGSGDQSLSAAASSLLGSGGSGGEAVVTIQAMDPDAAEEGQDPGDVTIFRAGGDLSAPLTVFYNVNGTAYSGADYSGSDEGVSSIEIPAYETSVTLSFIPVDDDEAEGQETISVFLIEPPSGSMYTVSSVFERADVLLVDNEAAAPLPQTKLRPPSGTPEQAGHGTVGVVAYGERKLNNDNVGAANAKDNFVSMDAIFTQTNVLDVVFEAYDTNGTSEFKFEVNVVNQTAGEWTKMEFSLGFGKWATPADGFQLSNEFDFLDFDFVHLDPSPEDAYKRFQGGTFDHDSNEMKWAGGRVRANQTAVFFFQVDLPDYSTEMPASARTATGYKFTLRMRPRP